MSLIKKKSTRKFNIRKRKNSSSEEDTDNAKENTIGFR